MQDSSSCGRRRWARGWSISVVAVGGGGGQEAGRSLLRRRRQREAGRAAASSAAVLPLSLFFFSSPDAAAQGNPIAYREHADLDPGINGQGFVKLQHEIPVILDVLPHWSIGWGHHGTVPQSVVVADHAPNLNQINQPLVVVEVVVLVSIHEYEVVCAMVLWL
nr:hypothetical protein Iba_chr14dCG9120 [Ipomoea batatas]GME07648.1 hypothetical protein Iba_scaffold6395CG0650 [Ipomoea batatas]